MKIIIQSKPLPERLAYEIFNYLPLNDLRACLRIHKSWYNFIRSHIWPHNYLPLSLVFERRAKTFSKSPSIVYRNQTLSYGEVNLYANKLANYLIKLNLPDEARVCIYLPYTPAIFISILAIWKAGLVYVPLPRGTEVSEQRLLKCIDECEPSVVITTSELQNAKVTQHAQDTLKSNIILITEMGEFTNLNNHQLETNNPKIKVSPNQLAYIMYTSGSTGDPKGVSVEHKGLLNSILPNCNIIEVNQSDKILQIAGTSFDAHIMEWGLSFVKEALPLYIFPRQLNGRLPLEQLGVFCKTNEITVGIFTPTTLLILNIRDFQSLRALICVGEHLSPEIVKEWSDGRKFVNGYGVTECSIGASLGRLDSNDPVNAGEIIPGLEGHLSTKGELRLSGIGLARGYWRRRYITEKHFVWKQLRSNNLEILRYYKTGDLASIDLTNKLTILGRKDREVKIHAKRICPEEIEQCIEGCYPKIRAFVDIYKTANASVSLQMVAFLFGEKDLVIDKELLLNHLKKNLTSSMFPVLWVRLTKEDLEMVKSANAKIDRDKLKQLFLESKMMPLHMIGYNETYPRDEIEKYISSQWVKIISINQEYLPYKRLLLYTDSNFFHLGGTSILALKMLQEISTFYKLADLPKLINHFYHYPTLAALARYIRMYKEKESNTYEKPLLNFRTEKYHTGKRPNAKQGTLFLIHSLMGKCDIDYAHFINKFRDEQINIRGFTALGISNLFRAQDDIGEIANCYLEEVYDYEEPYVFLGWSAGGTIAYEMARLCQEAGKICSVIMVDSESPSFFQSRSTESFAEKYFIRFLQDEYVIEQLGGITAEEIQEYLALKKLNGMTRVEQIHYIFNNIKNKILSIHGQGSAQYLNFLETVRSIYIALLHYSVNPCPESATLIAASESQEKMSDDRLGWPTDLPITLIKVQGNHFNIMVPDKKDSSKDSFFDYANLVNKVMVDLEKKIYVRNRSQLLNLKSTETDVNNWLQDVSHNLANLFHQRKVLRDSGDEDPIPVKNLVTHLNAMLKPQHQDSKEYKKFSRHLLLVCTWNGELDLFDQIVSTYKIDYLEAKDEQDSDCLHLCALQGHILMFDHLVVKYTWPLRNTNKKGLDVLLHAASNGKKAMFDHLVDQYQWNLRTVTFDGRDALLCGVQSGNTDFFDHLVNTYQWNITVTDNENRDALEIARAKGVAVMVAHLTNKYAWRSRSKIRLFKTLQTLTSQGNSAEFDRLASEHSLDFAKKDKKIGYDLLFLASWENQKEMFDHLIAKYHILYFEARNNDGSDCLHNTAWRGNIDMFKHLVREYRWPLTNINNPGYNLVLHAACTGQIAMFDLLVEYGVDKNWVDSEGNDALLCAVFGAHTEFFDHLIKNHSWNIKTVNHEGRGVYELACLARGDKMLRHLAMFYNDIFQIRSKVEKDLEKIVVEQPPAAFDAVVSKYNFDFSKREKKLGYTLLLKCAWNGNIQMFDHLARRYQIDVYNARNNDGSDALHHTAWRGHILMFDHLVTQYKWELTHINRGGLDLLLHAASNGQVEMFDHIAKKYTWDLQTVSSTGEDALLCAVNCQSIKLFDHLTGIYKWNLETRNYNGDDALTLARKHNRSLMLDHIQHIYSARKVKNM